MLTGMVVVVVVHARLCAKQIIRCKAKYRELLLLRTAATHLRMEAMHTFTVLRTLRAERGTNVMQTDGGEWRRFRIIVGIRSTYESPREKFSQMARVPATVSKKAMAHFE